MAIIHQMECDRCERRESMRAKDTKPEGWTHVNGRWDLCVACSMALGELIVAFIGKAEK